MDLSPYQIVAVLADEGRYICSESTIYRLMRKAKLNAHRLRSRAPVYSEKEPLLATAPNQIWSWDISYLKGPQKKVFYYLYLFVDIFSRKIIGYLVHETECSIAASDLVEKLTAKNNIAPESLRIHSDNGQPMRSVCFSQTLENLGVQQSFSRPRVSNDNPYSESLFKTFKYRPSYPTSRFESIEEARVWAQKFVNWYNLEHRHSSIGYVTPEQKHSGEALSLLENRKSLYVKAAQKNPKRFRNGIRKFETPSEARLYGYRTRRS